MLLLIYHLKVWYVLPKLYSVTQRETDFKACLTCPYTKVACMEITFCYDL